MGLRSIGDMQNRNFNDIIKQKKDYEYLQHIGEPIPKSKLIGKRSFDIIFGLVGFVISIPLILVFGLIIKATSPGPVLFKQERVGYLGNSD